MFRTRRNYSLMVALQHKHESEKLLRHLGEERVTILEIGRNRSELLFFT